MPNANILLNGLDKPTGAAALFDGIKAHDEIEQMPIRNRLLEAQTGRQEVGLDKDKAMFQMQDMAQDAAGLKRVLASGTPDSINRARVALAQRIQKINDRGGDSSDSAALMQQLEAGDIEGVNAELDAVLADAQRFGVMGNAQATQQFGAQTTVKDSKGNLYFATQKRDPNTGAVQSVLSPVGDAPASPVGGVQVVGSFGETADEALARSLNKAKGTADIDVDAAGGKKGREAAVTQGMKAFEKIEPLRKNIANYDEAIRLVNEGAGTGAIQSKLPSLQQASIELDNLQGQLGLDVIGDTTFGALSESELKFALSTALPTSLEGPALVDWLKRKKEAQTKLLRYTEEAAQYLSSGKNTITDFIEERRSAQRSQGSDAKSDPLGLRR